MIVIYPAANRQIEMAKKKWRMMDCDNNNWNGEDQMLQKQIGFFLKRHFGCHKFRCWASFKQSMKKQLSLFLQQIDKMGGDARRLIFEAPASFDDIYEIEQTLKYTVPEDFKKTLLSLSSHCEFKWFLPDNFQLPNELRQIFCGELHWGTNFIIQFNNDKNGWVKDVFPDVTNEYDRVWHNKFVFQEVGNGDFISIDLTPHSYGKIVYLSHDDGEGHGYIMANSFSELLKNWTQLGCVGGEDWQWLPFCESKTSCIDPSCENAKLWHKTIGL